MTSEVFWRGVFPWCATLAGGALSAFVAWLSVRRHYDGVVAGQTKRRKDKKVAEQEAREKLETLGTFAPELKLALWQGSVKPLFFFSLLFPLGKHLSTNSPEFVACVSLAVIALFVSLSHEFLWRETFPDKDTWWRMALVGFLWSVTLGVAIWVTSPPASPPVSSQAAPVDSSVNTP